MTIYVGGKRLRIIKDNLQNVVSDSLDALGWFDTGRRHKAVQVVGHQLDNSVELKPNIVGISMEDMDSEEMELGSNLEENRWELFVDIFAESEDVGIHLAGDVQDILRGKMSSIGRTGPSFAVLDLALATPTELFICELENISIARNRDWAKPFNQYWWTVFAEIIDVYSDEEDD